MTQPEERDNNNTGTSDNNVTAVPIQSSSLNVLLVIDKGHDNWESFTGSVCMCLRPHGRTRTFL